MNTTQRAAVLVLLASGEFTQGQIAELIGVTRRTVERYSASVRRS